VILTKENNLMAKILQFHEIMKIRLRAFGVILELKAIA